MKIFYYIAVVPNIIYCLKFLKESIFFFPEICIPHRQAVNFQNILFCVYFCLFLSIATLNVSLFNVSVVISSSKL